MQKNNHLYYNKLDFEKNILNNNIPKYFVKMSKLYEEIMIAIFLFIR